MLTKDLPLAAFALLLSLFCGESCNSVLAFPVDHWSRYAVGDFGPTDLRTLYNFAPPEKSLEEEMAEKATRRRGFLIKIGNEYRLYASKQVFTAKPNSLYTVLVFAKPYKCNTTGENARVSGYLLDDNRLLVTAVEVFLSGPKSKTASRSKTTSTKP